MNFAGTPSAILHDWRGTVQPGTITTRPGAVINVPCGSCVLCCRSAMLVKLTDVEAQRLPHTTDENGAKYLAQRGRDCAMFDAQNNRCSIYVARPEACRTYDCRGLWLAGFRNTERGREVNERLESWRTEVHSDIDLGIIALVWIQARVFLQDCKDVGLAAGAAVMRAAFTRDDDLPKLGRKARRDGVHNVIATLNGDVKRRIDV